MPEHILTTDITPMDILISVGCLAVFLYWAQGLSKDVIENIKNKLMKSLNRVGEKKASEPLVKIFYKFNHSSVTAWASWVNSQEDAIKRKAFNRLKDYLDEPNKEQGALSLDAIRAIANFNFGERFEVLEELLETIRSDWGKYIALENNYKECLLGLIQIDTDGAIETFYRELVALKSKANTTELKKALLEASSKIETDSELKDKILIEAICDFKENAEVKNLAINLILKIDNEEKLLEIYTKLINFYIHDNPGELSRDELSIYKQILNISSKLVHVEEIWKLFMESYKNTTLASATANVLCDIFSDPNYQFSIEQLYKGLTINKEFKKEVTQSLASKFKLSVEEKTILQEKSWVDEYEFKTDFTNEENLEEPIHTSEYFSNTFKSVIDALSANSTTAKSITQIHKLDAIYILRAFASQNSKKYIFIDASKLLLVPNKLKDIKALIESDRNCLVHWANSEKLFGKFGGLSFSKTVLETIHELSKNPKTINVLSTDTNVSLKPEIKELIATSIKVDELGERQREQCINYYLGKLSNQRESKELTQEHLLGYVDKLSLIETNSELVKLIKTSLLVKGQLLSIPEYKALEKNQEVQT